MRGRDAGNLELQDVRSPLPYQQTVSPKRTTRGRAAPKPKTALLSRESWLAKFRAYASRNATCGHLLARLNRNGCELVTVEELLYSAAELGGRPMAQWKREEQLYIREAKLLTRDCNALIRRVRYVNEWALPEHWDGSSSRATINGKQCNVPLEYFEYLPEIIESYAQLLEFMIGMGHLRSIDEREPDLAILASYLRFKTGRTPYSSLSMLIDDAHACIDRTSEQSPESVRKALKRYEHSHPKVCGLISDLLLRYEQASRSERAQLGSTVSYIRAGLMRSHLLLHRKSH